MAKHDNDTPRRKGTSDAQLDAAIEGATPGHGSDFGIQGGPDTERFGGGSGRAGSGNPMGGGGLGIDTSGAGPGEQPDDPSAETGGPRGSGTSISATSGGRTNPGDVQQHDPADLVRERTSRPVAERERAAGSGDNQE